MRITSNYSRQWLTIALVSIASAFAPQVHAATPDLSGPWQVKTPGQALTTVDGEMPPLLPAAQQLYQANMAAKKANPQVDPMAACLPPGVPRLMAQAYPFNIVQGRRTISMMFEWNHLTRLVYMDRDHFKTIGPVYMGQSVGHWDGNVLVVDTNSFNDETWLDDTGLPHSRALHTVEHIKLLPSGRELEDRITFEDPKTFSKPWSATLVFTKKSGILIKEDYCLGRNGQGTMTVK